MAITLIGVADPNFGRALRSLRQICLRIEQRAIRENSAAQLGAAVREWIKDFGELASCYDLRCGNENNKTAINMAELRVHNMHSHLVSAYTEYGGPRITSARPSEAAHNPNVKQGFKSGTRHPTLTVMAVAKRRVQLRASDPLRSRLCLRARLTSVPSHPVTMSRRTYIGPEAFYQPRECWEKLLGPNGALDCFAHELRGTHGLRANAWELPRNVSIQDICIDQVWAALTVGGINEESAGDGVARYLARADPCRADARTARSAEEQLAWLEEGEARSAS